MGEQTSGDDSQTPEAESQDPATRRSFLGLMSGVIAGVMTMILGVPLVGSFLSPLFEKKKPLWVRLGKTPVDFARPQRYTFRYVRIDGWQEKTVHGTAYAVKGAGGMHVLSNVCTHLGCGVRWDDDQEAFLCPCHKGKFDKEGTPISGPPPKSLNRFAHRIVGDELEIQIKEV